MGSLLEKKYLYLLYEGGVWFFGDGENSLFVFDELLCLSSCLFIDYLCIYWILFKSFGIFVTAFQGLYLQRGMFLRSKQGGTNVSKQNQT